MKWLILLIIILAAMFYFFPEETKDITGMVVRSLEPAKDNFIDELKGSDIASNVKEAAKEKVREEVNNKVKEIN